MVKRLINHEDCPRNYKTGSSKVMKVKLSIDVLEPEFLCDHSHHIKFMVKDIFGLALMSKTKSECEKIDAFRLNIYIYEIVGW